MTDLRVLSEIDARVWKIEVAPGDSVTADMTLLILEAMKTEIPVEAPRAGRVKEIMVKAEDPVSEGQVLLILEV
ncbi:MAG: acetyl-CoA carboxylase biotin carboxyl carrier protein subunit [Alphaproteobacteria bacterium]|nr:acetyl-CoA carboxylase biotin carboxyl carrier protein subunit [Alphaproteobacteria bacterium]